MNCRINPKDLYRPLHPVASRRESRRGSFSTKGSLVLMNRNLKIGSSREKVAVCRSPGLIIKVCMSNRPFLNEGPENLRSKTPQDRRSRPLTGLRRDHSGFNQKFNGLEGVKVRCKSISSTPVELRGANRKKMLRAVIPKVENLQGWTFETWKVWFMDVSKQGFSAGLLHVLNLYLSSSTRGVEACVWYFLNFFIDTVVGMGLCYLILHLVERCLRNSPTFRFKSGHYGPDNDMGIWAYQMFIWLAIILLVKLIIWTFMSLFHIPLEFIGEKVLTPFSFNPDVELVTVMIVIPLIVNSAYFWITDNFLKAHQKKTIESEFELLPDQQKNKFFY